MRARRPFVVKNAVTGLAIVGFTAAVCMFPFPPSFLCDHRSGMAGTGSKVWVVG